MSDDIQPLAFTIPAAIRASGVARTRLYELIADGQVLAVKSGRRTLVRADSLRSYLASLPPVTIRRSQKAA